MNAYDFKPGSAESEVIKSYYMKAEMNRIRLERNELISRAKLDFFTKKTENARHEWQMTEAGLRSVTDRLH